MEDEQDEFEIGVNSLVKEQAVKFNEIIEYLRRAHGDNFDECNAFHSLSQDIPTTCDLLPANIDSYHKTG